MGAFCSRHRKRCICQGTGGWLPGKRSQGSLIGDRTMREWLKLMLEEIRRREAEEERARPAPAENAGKPVSPPPGDPAAAGSAPAKPDRSD